MVTQKLNGITVLITGATSGIGLVAATELASYGAKILFLARDQHKAETLLTALGHLSEQEHSYAICDMLLMNDINMALDKIKHRLEKIDIVVNNAGTWFSKREVTSESVERTFAVNYLAYVQVALQLKELLQRSRQGHLINTASFYHQEKYNPNDMQLGHGYSMSKAYGVSKLYDILFTRELGRRWKKDGIAVNCFNPGSVNSNFGRGQGGWMGPLISLQKKLFGKSPREDAEPLLYLALSSLTPELTGRYLDGNQVKSPSKEPQSEANSRHLWEYIIELLEGIGAYKA